jgi:hypothetical protein
MKKPRNDYVKNGLPSGRPAGRYSRCVAAASVRSVKNTSFFEVRFVVQTGYGMHDPKFDSTKLYIYEITVIASLTL